VLSYLLDPGTVVIPPNSDLSTGETSASKDEEFIDSEDEAIVEGSDCPVAAVCIIYIS